MTAKVVRLDELVVPGKPLGRHVEHDPLSRNFAVAELSAAVLRRIRHRRYGGPFDQGQLGSCTGNSGEGVMNTVPFHRTGTKLSTETNAVDTYSKATHRDRFPGAYPPEDTGSSGIAVAKVLLSEGRIASYRHAFSLKGAVSALQTVPVMTGVPWFEGFDEPDPDTALVRIAGQIRGGHEFEVLAFEPASTNDPLLDGILEAVNSWGLAYGIRGRFRFTGRTWGDLLEQQGDVTVLTPLAA